MIDDNVIESLEQTEETTPTVEAPKVDQAEVERRAEEMFQARNFKEMRNQLDQMARERNEYKRIAEQRYAQPEPEDTTDDDAFVEAKHLKQFKKYQDSELAKLQRKIEEQQAAIVDQNIRSACPDFERVVTEQTLIKLRNEYPEVAASLNSSQDVQSKAIAAYKLIKKLELHNPQNDLDRERIAQNIAKPKPSAVLPKTDTDLSRANAFENGLTDAQKEEIFKRATKFASQA